MNEYFLYMENKWFLPDFIITLLALQYNGVLTISTYSQHIFGYTELNVLIDW